MHKNQVIFIRGGEAFDTVEEFHHYLREREYDPRKPWYEKKSWRNWISWALSDNFEAFEPQMPNKQWATYEAWKIWFEKLLPYLNDQQLVLIGSSLGGLFLVKYLSENDFPKQIDQLHLVAPVLDNEGLADEKVGDFVLDRTQVALVEAKVGKVWIYGSTDDTTTPITHCEQYQELLPNAIFLRFANRGHFNQPAFPELLENINTLGK